MPKITSKIKASILIPIPRYGFDTTEVSVPWKYLVTAGHEVTFATPDGHPGQADNRMLTGKGLGCLKRVLMADENGVHTYQEVAQTRNFQNPISYAEIYSETFDALFIPGGHDKGMIEYLESKVLQRLIVEFFEANKPVGAICHGTLLVGRNVSPGSGKSVLWGRKTTGLTRPQELTAFNLTRLYLGDYYRTYPEVAMEDELKSFLHETSQFSRGPGFPIPLRRDSAARPDLGYTVRDLNYLSARWPGDAHRFGSEFVQLISEFTGLPSKLLA